MNNNKLELYLLKEVISKAKKDPFSERLTIYLNDYVFLNLSQSATKMLHKMCKEYNIDLEQLPPRMKVEETQRLMKEYINLKKKIEEAQDSSVIKEVNKLLADIKEKITLGHMQIVFDLINKNMPEIKDAQDREDIYQMGYELLLQLIDTYDDTKNATFLYYLNRHLVYRLNVKILAERTGINYAQANKLRRITLAIEKLQIKEINPKTIQELSNYTKRGIIEIENTLQIQRGLQHVEMDSFEEESPEDLVYYESYEEYPENITDDFSYEEYPEDLIYETFEEDTMDRMLEKNNHIRKLLATLNDNEREILNLYYGFEDGKCHTLEEISQIVKTVSRERIRQIKERGMIALTIQEKGKYLESIYGDSPYFYECTSYQQRESQEKLQELLLSTLPIQVFKDLTSDLNPVVTEVLMLYYGLQEERKYSYKEIQQKLKYSTGKRYSMKEMKWFKKLGTSLLLKRMCKRLNPNFKGDPVEYLTNYYLNKDESSKTKKRI